MKVKKLFWELVFNRMIIGNTQLNERHLECRLRALFHAFLLTCNSTSTAQVWARLKHFYFVKQT